MLQFSRLVTVLCINRHIDTVDSSCKISIHSMPKCTGNINTVDTVEKL